MNVDSDKGYIGTITDHDLRIGTNSNARIIVSNSGNVGIGVDPNLFMQDSTFLGPSHHPSLVLGDGDGHTSQTFYSATGSAGIIYFADGTGISHYAGYIQYTHSEDHMQFATNNLVRMRIDSAGNVGIGTSSPTGTLTIHPAETGNHILEIARNANKASIKAVGGGNTTTNQWLVMDSAGRGSGDYASINHFVNDNVLLAYGGGNVGVGTTDPGVYKFRVVGGHSSFEGGNVKFDGGNVTVNSTADNYDFRVEGNSDVNLFKTKASTDNVTIGAAPEFDYVKFLLYSYDKQYQQIIGGGSSGISLLVNSYINTGVSDATAFYSFTYPVSGASLNSLIHFRAQRPESSGTVTTERGFYTDVHDGNNNRGFEGHVPTGDGNYNLYMEGSGKNYLAGNLGVGTTGEITRSFEVYDTGVKSSGSFFFAAGNTTDAVGTYVANVNPTGDSFMSLGVDGSAVNWVLMNDASGRGTDDTFVLMKGNIASNDVKLAVTASGNVGIGTDSPAHKLDVNGMGRFVHADGMCG